MAARSSQPARGHGKAATTWRGPLPRRAPLSQAWKGRTARTSACKCLRRMRVPTPYHIHLCKKRLTLRLPGSARKSQKRFRHTPKFKFLSRINVQTGAQNGATLSLNLRGVTYYIFAGAGTAALKSRLRTRSGCRRRTSPRRARA